MLFFLPFFQKENQFTCSFLVDVAMFMVGFRLTGLILRASALFQLKVVSGFKLCLLVVAPIPHCISAFPPFSSRKHGQRFKIEAIRLRFKLKNLSIKMRKRLSAEFTCFVIGLSSNCINLKDTCHGSNNAV